MNIIHQFIGITLLASSSYAVAFSGIFPKEWAKSDEGIWQVAFEGQYFYQSNNLAQITSAATVPTNYVLPQAEWLNASFGAQPEQEWGYKANVGYVVPSHKYDIQGSYLWLRSDNKTSASRDFTTTDFFSDTYEINSAGKFHYDFTQADLTVGQYLHPIERLRMRLGYGLAYVDINQKGNSSNDTLDFYVIPASGNHFIDPIDTTGYVENKFRGAGPKFTMDGEWSLRSSWALVGGLGASLLYGESTAKLHSSSSLFAANSDELFSDSDSFKDEDNKFVFGLEGKLGLRFAKVMNNCVSWNIEAGYKGTEYFNALQDSSATLDLSNSALETTDIKFHDENYYNYGPYVTIGVDFM